LAEREKPVSRTQLAALFGVEVRTVTNWVQAGCPKRMLSGSPSFLLSEVIPWRREQDQKEQRGGALPKEDEERVRKLTADADMAELKRDELKGVLIQAALVERTWERVLGVLDARMTAARGKWAPKILGLGTMAEAVAAMDALIADLRAAFLEGADELEAEEPETEEAA
jgi:hypothetical protein